MSKYLQLLIQLLANAVTVVIAYLINQISSVEKLSLKGLSQTDIWILSLVAAGVVAIASINVVSSDSSSSSSQSRSATTAWALASGIPVGLSVALYVGLKSRFLPLEYSREIFYIALGLFFIGAVLPLVLMWRGTQSRGIHQETASDTVPATSPQTPEYWRRELLKIMRDDVVNVGLEDLLHNEQLIPLLMEDQREQVGRPKKMRVNSNPDSLKHWLQPDRWLEILGVSKTQLKPCKKIIEVFEQDDIVGRLLILGAPGSGKTTTLLELARDLIQRAQQQPDQPIPVIFELSYWKDDKQSIADWLVAYLNERNNIPEAITRQWIKTGQLLPLLDGLDELGLIRQARCVDKINEYLQTSSGQSQIVVCCRQEEYLEGNAILEKLRGAICLQALTDGQIENYLKRLGCGHLWKPIKEDPEGLLELARMPLLLNLIPVAYPDGLQQRGRRFNNPTERQKYQEKSRRELFDAYIKRRLEQHYDHQGYSEQETKGWLIWLAKTLQEEKQTEFLIEKMQPHYLKNKLRQWQYWLLLFIMNLLTSGTIATVVHSQWSQAHHSFSWKFLLNSIVIWGLAGGFLLSTESKADGRRLIMYPFVQFFCFLLRKKLPTEFREHIPILHDIDLSSRFRLKVPSIRTLKEEVFKPSLGMALLPYDFISTLIMLLIMVMNKPSGGLAYQYVHMIKLRGGRLLNLAFKILTIFPGILPSMIYFIVSLLSILVTEEIKRYTAPNQGLHEALRSSFLISILFCISSFMAFQMPATYYRGISCVLGFLACYSYLPLIKHLSLRLVLWQSGTIPWNYARFLSYAAKRRFIKQAGGRYRFLHDLLREHFADMDKTGSAIKSS